MRIRSTIRHISSRLNSPTSQPAGWFRRVRWIANTVVGSRSSSTRIGDIETPSIEQRRVLRDRRRAACRRGSWRSRAPASSNSVISRNSRNCEDVVLEDAILLALRRGRCPAGRRRALSAARRWWRRSGGFPRRRAWRRSGCPATTDRGCRAGARGSRRRRRRAAARRRPAPSSSAKRVAMCRFEVAIVSFGWPARIGGRLPEAERRQRRRGPASTGTSKRVLTARARSLQARKIAGGSSTMACWNARHAVTVLVVGGGVADAIEGRVDRRAADRLPVERPPVSASAGTDRNRLGPLMRVDQHRLELAARIARCRAASCVNFFDVHVDADRGELPLHGQRDPLVDRVGGTRHVNVKCRPGELRARGFGVERESRRVLLERPVLRPDGSGRRQCRGRSAPSRTNASRSIAAFSARRISGDCKRGDCGFEHDRCTDSAGRNENTATLLDACSESRRRRSTSYSMSRLPRSNSAHAARTSDRS